MNWGPADLKGSLVRRGFDPVRQQLAAMMSRFLWSTGATLVLVVGWWWLQPLSPTKRALVLALCGAAVLARLTSDLAPRLLTTQAEVQTGKWVLKVEDVHGTIELIALPALPGAVERWFCVGMRGRWRTFATPWGVVGCRTTGRWLWELAPSVLPAADMRALPFDTRTTVPPEPMLRVGRGLPIADGSGVTGTLRSLIDEPISATAGKSLALTELPAEVREMLAHGDGDDAALASHVAGSVDPTGRARMYALESTAFVDTIYVVPILDRFAGTDRTTALGEPPDDTREEQ